VETSDIHLILAALPHTNEPNRYALLSAWERYELEYARDAVWDRRPVPAATVATLARAAARLGDTHGQK
jgi:hypothetical protein